MKAKVYVLNPSDMTWHLTEVFDNVDNKLYQRLQAYAEYYLGQVRIEYS